MGKKGRGNKAAQHAEEDVHVVNAEGDEEIATPVKPRQEEEAAAVQTTQQQEQEVEGDAAPENDCNELEEEESVKEQDVLPTTPDQELSPGGESPQGKKDRSGTAAGETAAAVVDELTEPAAARQEESPTSTVNTEPLLPSTGASDSGASSHTTPAAATATTTNQRTAFHGKVVTVAGEVWEMPIVQFVAVIAQRLTVSVLIILINLFRFLRSIKVCAKAESFVRKQLTEAGGGLVQVKQEKVIEYFSAKLLTPLGLLDTNTMQGHAFAVGLAGGQEIVDEALSLVEKHTTKKSQ